MWSTPPFATLYLGAPPRGLAPPTPVASGDPRTRKGPPGPPPRRVRGARGADVTPMWVGPSYDGSMGVEQLPPESARLGEGRYALVSKIGEGGMSAVYRALDRKLRVWRAIKVLQPRAAQIPEIRANFNREAQTMALLEHPHLVRVYDVGELEAHDDTPPLPFLVMELVEGGTLDQWVERHGKMPPRMAVDATRQVARALAAVHAFGVVHRDVKPNNVLVTPAGLCKLTDFGVARTEAEGATRLRVGTRGYMAPEQRNAPETVDARADLYGLGATLWRLLRAEPPQDLFLVDTQPLLLRGIPPRLHPLLVRCLAHKRERRFPSAAAVAAALDEVIEQLPEVAAGVPPLAQPIEQLDRPNSGASTFDTDSERSYASSLSTADLVTPLPRTGPEVAGRSGTSGTPVSASDPAWMVRGSTPRPREPVVIGGQGPAASQAVGLSGGIPGKALVEGPPPAPVVQARDPWRIAVVALGAGFAVMLAILFVLVFSVASSRSRLATARDETHRTEDALVQVVRDQQGLIEDLPAGAQKRALEQRYLDLVDARGADRYVAAERLVPDLELLIGNNLDLHSRDVDAFQLSERLKALRGARREHDRALREWHMASNTLGGRLVVWIHLADPAP
ncbi:MAG: serine/threonine-protein kinase [Myxococcota bacterium]